MASGMLLGGGIAGIIRRGDWRVRQHHRKGEPFRRVSQAMTAAFVEDAVIIVSALILMVAAR